VDLIGIEPMTSSMPFRRVSKHQSRAGDTTRHSKAVFMLVIRTFAAFRVCLSDTARDDPTRIGIGGL
jgi:hypothetical protein